MRHRALLALFLFSVLPASARAQSEPVDHWTEPNPGVRYLERRIDSIPVVLHAAVIDLAKPGVRVIATPQAERWSTVSDFGRARHAAVAVNGGFWGMWQYPTGVTAGGGRLWRGAEPDPEFGHFGITRDGRAVVYAAGEGEGRGDIADLSDSVSGRPLIVAGGDIAHESLQAFENSRYRQPRTAVGVSEDGRTVILVVVDGRQHHSRGLTLYQLARVMIGLGAHRAINLDGGGSSAMYVESEGGLVNSPCRGRWMAALGLDGEERRGRDMYVRGVEREVMNHLAVIAPPHPVASAPIAQPSVPAPRVASFVPSNDAPVRFGRAREIVVPVLSLALPCSCALAPLLWWRRRRRRRQRADESADPVPPALGPLAAGNFR